MFRYSILNFFQDIHVRISAFLQDKVQHNSGRFVVAPPVEVFTRHHAPGTIRFMDTAGEVVETTKFHPGQSYKWGYNTDCVSFHHSKPWFLY